MKVIVNADDFGMDDDTVSATVALLESGVVTSATIMPNMPSTEVALRHAASLPSASFGVHLVFAGSGAERPVSPEHRVASLIDPEGRFASPTTQRLRALAGRLSVEEIATEMRAQIGRIVDHGVAPTHIDTHHHLHKLAPFRSALERVLPQFGIRRVRIAQNLPVGLNPLRWTWWNGERAARRLRASFVGTDWFVMLDDGRPAQWWTRYPWLRSAHGVLEFGCHPGSIEPWRRAERDAAVEFAIWCDEADIERIGWRQVA